MEREMKITERYKLGFSLRGIVIYMLQLLPNIIWMLIPPVNDILAENNSAYPVFNIIEHVFGIVTVAVLILLVNKGSERKKRVKYIGLAAVFLTGYYISWIFYYTGVVSPWILVAGIAGMPPLYFLFAGLWLENYAAVIPCVIFGITHVAITCSNYLG